MSKIIYNFGINVIRLTYHFITTIGKAAGCDDQNAFAVFLSSKLPYKPILLLNTMPCSRFDLYV